MSKSTAAKRLSSALPTSTGTGAGRGRAPAGRGIAGATESTGGPSPSIRCPSQPAPSSFE